MHLSIVESKKSKYLYVIRSTYENGRNSSERVEKLGTYAELLEKLNGQDPIAWAKAYIADLNEKEKAGKREVTIAFSPEKRIEKKSASPAQWRVSFSPSNLLRIRTRFHR